MNVNSANLQHTVPSYYGYYPPPMIKMVRMENSGARTVPYEETSKEEEEKPKKNYRTKKRAHFTSVDPKKFINPHKFYRFYSVNMISISFSTFHTGFYHFRRKPIISSETRTVQLLQDPNQSIGLLQDKSNHFFCRRKLKRILSSIVNAFCEFQIPTILSIEIIQYLVG